MKLRVSRSFFPLLGIRPDGSEDRDNQAARSRYLLMCGGAGSGKSQTAARKLVLRAQTEMGGHRFLVMRKIRATLRESCVALIESILQENRVEYAYHKTDRVLTFRNPAGWENHFIFDGLDNPEKIKSIQGLTGLWLEEATEFSEQDFTQLDLRLRGDTPNYKQIIATFNPVESEAPWLKKKFFDRIHPDSHVHRSTVRDNPFIDREYLRILDAIDDPTYRKIYRFGQWAVAKGLIYERWDVASTWPEDFDDRWWGLDFGFNNPTALVFIGMKDREIYLRLHLYRTNMTNQDRIAFLNTLVAAGTLRRTDPIYGDAAEPASIEEIHRAGFNCLPAQKDVKDGIDTVKRYRLHVHPESGDLIDELKTYKWKEDKKGNVLDEPVKFKDHALDGTRYGVHTHLVKPETVYIGQSAGDFFSR